MRWHELDTPLAALLRHWHADPRFRQRIAAWGWTPARPARIVPFPEDLDPRWRAALTRAGYAGLYVHQAEAYRAARQGAHVALFTGTASGKTLAFLLPILQTLCEDPQATALFLYPTKALAHDQRAIFRAWLSALGLPAAALPYDGDTPSEARRFVRERGRLLVTNPDMLHRGLLPWHPRWASFLSHLRFVVIDEAHVYRGVFGSHVVNVLRRLRRLAARYGAAPQFLLGSATVANGRELAEGLVEASVHLIETDGAPSGERHFLLYNPPLVDAALGLRQNALAAAADLIGTLLAHGIPTIAFARSRMAVERLLRRVRAAWLAGGGDPQIIQGYRGGYLPETRRAIEKGLREGQIRCVIATNALELGVDIGNLEACVMVGYPGTIASARQQAGRAGRRAPLSVAIMVLTPTPLDQYLAGHPEFLFERSPEAARFDPDNLALLAGHLLCAAFEHPLDPGEAFARTLDTDRLVALLMEDGAPLYRNPTDGRVYFAADRYPAGSLSLRTGTGDRIAVRVRRGGEGHRIGEVDRPSAPCLIHPGAVYLHEGQAYRIQVVDWERREAWAEPFEEDEITEPMVEATWRLDLERARRATPWAAGAWGEVTITSRVVGARRLRWSDGAPLGTMAVETPETALSTTAWWLTLHPTLVRRLEAEGITLGPLDYGPDWEALRRAVRARDGHRCRICGAPEPPGQAHDVHHLRPLRTFRDRREAHALENLITVCRPCHRRLERGLGTRSALSGLGALLHGLAPLFLMSDPADLGLLVDPEGRETGGPTVLLYEQMPGGVGFAEHLWAVQEALLEAAREVAATCPCEAGCPACVGPPVAFMNLKAETRRLLEALREPTGGLPQNG
ncbi:MAG: ATP-dependent helicase [Thermoflexus sp.]|uniref:DEAD/DEAH box helicase n=1 Tax=Thermoflexus sp. TaxID=1969742 RepID=UPI00331CB8D5